MEHKIIVAIYLIVLCVISFILPRISHKIERCINRYKAIQNFKATHDENQILECANKICEAYSEYSSEDVFLVCRTFERLSVQSYFYEEILECYDEFYQFMQPDKSAEALKKYVDGNIIALRNLYANLRKDGLLK